MTSVSLSNNKKAAVNLTAAFFLLFYSSPSPDSGGSPLDSEDDEDDEPDEEDEDEDEDEDGDDEELDDDEWDDEEDEDFEEELLLETPPSCTPSHVSGMLSGLYQPVAVLEQLGPARFPVAVQYSLDTIFP